MHRQLRHLSLVLCAALPFAACDNVGRAFDPVRDPPTGGPQVGSSDIQAPPLGGDARDGRPVVRQTYPKGGGWPTSVPVVVEFSESMNESTLAPTTPGGTDGRLIVRVKGSQQALPATYAFLGAGRLLVVRPTPALSNAQNPSYEVVLLPGARDADGVRFRSEEEEVLAEFTVDAATEEEDGEILALFPRDNARDVARSTDLTVVFTRPANPASVTAAAFSVRTAGGTVIDGDLDFPLEVVPGTTDPRIVRFTPDDLLGGNVEHQLVVTSAITFGTAGTLQFNGRTPFARFTTTGVPEPTSVSVSNASAGFPDKINRANVANLQLAVDVPADALAGDRVVARIYGGDRSTANNTADLAFVERTAVLAANGTQTVTVDFTGELGTVDRPDFDDAEVRLLAQLHRGQAHSGFVYGDDDARFDVTLPQIVRIGPPGPATGTDAYTDQEWLAFYGTASERLGAAELVVGASMFQLFGSSQNGRFVMRPVQLGRQLAPRAYSLNITDAAGNMIAGPITGNIVQRGLLDGAVAGTLTVEAYDDATLLPIANATVIVDPGAPTVPADPGRIVLTTDAAGRASFAVAAASHTVTIVHPEYDLTTLYDSTAAFASLPCTPRGDSSATFRGNAVFTATPTGPPPNTTVLVGNNVFADPTLLAIATAPASPTAIPRTPIRSNRPQVVTALGGAFEPTATPTFFANGCTMCGVTLTEPSPPAAAVDAGGDSNVTVALLPAAGGLIGGLVTLGVEDFGLATGLDTGNLVGGRPIVRCTLSLNGFPGQALFGVGFATAGAGANYTIDASYSLPIAAGLAAYGSAQWVVTEARDASGNTSRHRSFLLPDGTLFDALDPMPIPVITAPATSTGPPAIDLADVLDPAASLGLGLVDLVAQDPAGRQWTLLITDQDGRGGTDAVQFPALTGSGATGLDVGNWSLRANSRVFLSLGATPGNVVLAERLRQEIGLARGAAVTVAVQ